MAKAIEIAVELAKEVGELQASRVCGDHRIEFKGKIDIVTEVDKLSEKIIVERLHKEFPYYDILAEEGSGNRKNSDCRWIVDPLDATVNYSHGYPYFGPAIALEKKGELVLGVIYIPLRDELFVAETGGGTYLNNIKVRVSEVSELHKSLIATGFPYSIHEGKEPDNLDHFSNFAKKVQAVRRAGMAAGDLAYLACGRLDASWQLLLKPWDIAAGTLMVKEAGGEVTNFNGLPIDIYGKNMVASNGFLHKEMLEILKKGKY